MSWESFDWKPADGQPLGAGAPILPLWPMLKSAIAEAISADALCPVTIGDLTVGTSTSPTRRRRWPRARSSCWAPTGAAPGRPSTRPRATRSAATSTPPNGSRIWSWRAWTALSSDPRRGPRARRGGRDLGADAPMLLLRLPITSVDNEELVLVSAYDDAVAGELSAHIVALQALAAEAPHDAASAPAAPVSQRAQEFKAPAAARRAAPGRRARAGASATAARPRLPANVRPGPSAELTAARPGSPATTSTCCSA
jgi:hypothetical protein